MLGDFFENSVQKGKVFIGRLSADDDAVQHVVDTTIVLQRARPWRPGWRMQLENGRLYLEFYRSPTTHEDVRYLAFLFSP